MQHSFVTHINYDAPYIWYQLLISFSLAHNILNSTEFHRCDGSDRPKTTRPRPPYLWNLDLGNEHEIAAWRMTHLPPRVYTNGDKHTIELQVVINRFGWFLLTMWSMNVLGRSYVAICRGCTFIYTRTTCSMDWNIPGGPMLEHAGYQWRSKQTRNLYFCTSTPERISQYLISYGLFILLYNFFEIQKRCEMLGM